MTLPRLALFVALLGVSIAAAPRHTRVSSQVQATLVSADTAGIFFRRGPDSLFVRNTTWASRDSAPAAPDCVYSGASRRGLARDSMRVTIRVNHSSWSLVLRPSSENHIVWSAPLRSGTFHLLDVSAPASPCGVNAGQIWFHWSITP